MENLISVDQLMFFMYSSLSSRLKILPAALLGNEFTKRTPAVILLYLDTRLATNSLTSSSPIGGSSPLSTTKASGASPDLSSGTPITAASNTFGWVLNSPSSSAGGTCAIKNIVSTVKFWAS